MQWRLIGSETLRTVMNAPTKSLSGSDLVDRLFVRRSSIAETVALKGQEFRDWGEVRLLKPLRV